MHQLQASMRLKTLVNLAIDNQFAKILSANFSLYINTQSAKVSPPNLFSVPHCRKGFIIKDFSLYMHVHMHV